MNGEIGPVADQKARNTNGKIGPDNLSENENGQLDLKELSFS